MNTCTSCGSIKIEANGLCASCNHANRKAEREASKPVKQPVPLKRVSTKQASIKNDLHQAYAYKATLTANQTHCSGCQSCYWDDHDHTISQKRCKELGKPELITNVDNFEYSCRQCHTEWESYKSGEFIKHKNFERRMAFVKLHDPEVWERRIAVWEAFTKPTRTI